MTEPMELQLSEIEVRVLGALIEKENTTPEYYPLSLNALVNACNQKSNRDPVLSLDEQSVRGGLEGLREKRLAREVNSFDSRVPKFAHQLAEVYNFDRREIAVLCVLLLRGAQTPGELRARTERMYKFDDLAAVESTLQRLIQREPELVKQVPQQPGTKEPRYVHLLGGDVAIEEVPPARRPAGEADSERMARLEAEVERLRNEVDELKQSLASFRRQFE
jgi:uncharacterized protein YceH (UPF0502 family)